MGKTKIIIVTFLEPKPLSFEFVKWPNHITLVPYFQISNLNSFIKEITNLCQNLYKLSYKVGPIDYFGPGKNIKVSRVEKSNNLLHLQSSLLKIALKYDKDIGISFCESNYQPHITHNNVPYPQENGSGLIKEIYVVENLAPSTKDKKIVGIINLK